MKKSELMSMFGALKSRLSAIQAKLNTIDNKADLGDSTNTLREAYSKLNNAISTMSKTLNGYVDKGEQCQYATLADFYAAKKTVAPKTETIEHGTTREKKKRDPFEWNGGWTYKHFNPSMTGVRIAGTGVKAEFCGACILLNGFSVFKAGVNAGWTLVSANYLAASEKMAALRNAVFAAANAVDSARQNCLASESQNLLNKLNTGALITETSALSTWFM